MISAATLRKLGTLGLSAEQMAGVLDLLADQMQADEDRARAEEAKREKDRDRKRRVRGHSTDIPRTETGNSEAASVENAETVFSIYKPHHLAKAVDPLAGLPSLYDFPPTMKQVREFLEPMAAREREMEDRERRRQQQLLPAPSRDPAEEIYVMDGLRQLSDHLAKGFGPSVVE